MQQGELLVPIKVLDTGYLLSVMKLAVVLNHLNPSVQHLLLLLEGVEQPAGLAGEGGKAVTC